MRIPPFFLTAQVDPPLAAIYEGDLPVSISAPFRSEDNGEALVPVLFRDLTPGSPDAGQEKLVAVGTDIPGSTYNDLSRSVNLRWEQPVLTGCHSLTLQLTYRYNLDESGVLANDQSLVASLVWWLNLGADREATTVSSCPKAEFRD